VHLLNVISIAIITAYGKQVPQCERFKYLGAIFNEDANGADEFSQRINLGYARLAALAPVLKRKNLSAKLKIKVIQTLVFPVVTYGCAAWNLVYAERIKLNSFEIKSYRRALGISYLTHTTNAEIFARAGTVAMLEASVERRKLSYFGHTVRHESLEQDIMLGIMEGKRRRGGQRKAWLDDITAWVNHRIGGTRKDTRRHNGQRSVGSEKDLHVPGVVAIARNRHHWRRLLYKIDNSSDSWNVT